MSILRDDATPAVVRALEDAQKWAQGASAPDVEPIHVLQAFLQEEEGRVATLLAQLGLDLDTIRRTFQADLRRAGGVSPPVPTAGTEIGRAHV